MKTGNTPFTRAARTLSLIALALSLPGGLLAQNASQNASSSSSSSQQRSDDRSSSSNSENDSAAHRVKVSRASTFLGTDVKASDGHKIGDIVDYYFEPASTPHLKYVVVMTGGFLGYGGDARAIPADALQLRDDSARVAISSDRYWDVAVLPQNRDRFLRDQRNTDRLARAFQMNDNQNAQSEKSDRSDQSGQSSADHSEKNRHNNNDNPSRLVAYTALVGSDVYDRDGQRIGRFADTWLDLGTNRAPYAEVSAPPVSPFEVTPRHRYAIPMSDLQTGRDQVTFNISESALRDSRFVSETEGVKILQSGDIGRQILQVRVAQQ